MCIIYGKKQGAHRETEAGWPVTQCTSVKNASLQPWSYPRYHVVVAFIRVVTIARYSLW